MPRKRTEQAGTGLRLFLGPPQGVWAPEHMPDLRDLYTAPFCSAPSLAFPTSTPRFLESPPPHVNDRPSQPDLTAARRRNGVAAQWLRGPGTRGCLLGGDDRDKAATSGPGPILVLEQTASPLSSVSRNHHLLKEIRHRTGTYLAREELQARQGSPGR